MIYLICIVDAVNRLIYSKSSKEASGDYLQKSRQNISQKPEKSNQSPPKEKAYPYGFKSNNALNEKENMRSQSPNRSHLKSQDLKGKSFKGNDFDTAYTELAQKLYNQKLRENPQGRETQLGKVQTADLLLSPKVTKEIQVKKPISTREQENVSRRLIEHGQILNEHTKALTEAYISKELEECTFAPKTNPNNTERRTHGKFLQDQKKFLDKIENKKKKLQDSIFAEQTENEGTYRPELCKVKNYFCKI